jgi:hypothetical protein
MSKENPDETESTDSKLLIDHRSPTTVAGRGEALPTGSAILKTTVAFDNPEITIDGWYTDDENRPPEAISRREVSIQLSDSQLHDRFSITTSVAADRARELAEDLLEAADIADGEVQPHRGADQ